MRQWKRLYSSKRIIQPTAPSGIPLHRILEPVFPLSVRESVSQWGKRHDLRSAEESLLKCVGLAPSDPVHPFTTRSLDIPVETVKNSVWRRSLQPQYMNELEVKDLTNSNDSHVVLVHGYGASKGYFYRNFKPLASQHIVHALDWLGYGLSSRPTPRLPRFPRKADGVHYAEDWFLKPFESWREQRKIEKFTFVAHSLGAYLACAYASRNPHRVEKLVLVSPASVDRTSVSIDVDELYPGLSEEAREMLLASVTAPPKVPGWFQYLWEKHWSPFSLVRNLGPLGPKLTSGWTSRRFASQPVAEQLALQDYSYRMFNAKGSGEYLLNYFLACGGAGRWPLLERLQGLNCPTLWLYGEHDWMNQEGGAQAVEKLRKRGQQAELQIIKNSGHHLYLDNERTFNKAVLQFLQSSAATE